MAFTGQGDSNFYQEEPLGIIDMVFLRFRFEFEERNSHSWNLAISFLGDTHSYIELPCTDLT